MYTIGELMVATVAAFVSTNVDGFVLLSSLLLSAQGDRRAVRRVSIAQGFATLVIVSSSVGIAYGLLALPVEFLRYLGLAPLFLGVRAILELARSGAAPSARPPVDGTVSACVALLSGGFDNVAVYAALFRELDPDRIAASAAVLCALGTALCVVGVWLGAAPRGGRVVVPMARVVAPVVLVVIGVVLLVREPG